MFKFNEIEARMRLDPNSVARMLASEFEAEKGNASSIAKKLGVSYRTLTRWMNKLAEQQVGVGKEQITFAEFIAEKRYETRQEVLGEQQARREKIKEERQAQREKVRSERSEREKEKRIQRLKPA